MVTPFTPPEKSTARDRPRQRRPRPDPAPEDPYYDFLNLDGLRVTSRPKVEDFSIWVTAEQFPKLQNCLLCGADDNWFILNGTRPQIIRDVPRGLRTLYLEVRRQSYFCYYCEGPFQHPLSSVSDEWRMTFPLVQFVEQLALLRPARQVALLTGASTRTVREILNEHLRHLDATVRFETPRVLGLDGVFARVKDEAGKRKKRECAIYTNIEEGLVIDLCPSITIDDVEKRLREFPHPERIKVVLIDMSSALLAAVRRALPHATVVIDLFHVQNKLNEGLDNVRKRLRRGATRRKGQPTMCSKELLRKRREQLEPDDLKDLERWFELKPQLRLAYETVEACLKVWHSSSSKTAWERYRRWLERFPLELRKDFHELLSAFRNWGEYIFNYFDHRFTNAFTESRNRMVKDIQRESRGCEFETLRGKLIYGPPLKKRLEEARREEMRRKKRKPQPQAAPKRRGRRKPPPNREAETGMTVGTETLQALLPALQMDLFSGFP